MKAGVIAWLTMTALSTIAVNIAWAADSSEYKNYVKVNLGMNDHTGDLDDAGYNAGVKFSGTYGRYLGKNLTIEGGVNNYQTNQKIEGSNTVAGSYTRKDTIFVRSILATLKGEFPVGPVTLYGGAGVGGYYVNLFSDIETSLQGDDKENNDDFVFGAHLVAGGHYDITPRFFVGVEGMYRWTGDVDIQDNSGSVPIKVKGNLNGYTVAALFGFRF
jgi:opacity protein-like surface antigen